MTLRVLVARLDSDGDVLLAGPAVRAAAAGLRGRPTEVAMLCGPAGRQAAELLPGVSRLFEWRCPWIDAHPHAVRADDVSAVVARLTAWRADMALVLTSFHQSPLPLALLLRLAGVGHISAVSVDYPGTLLDARLRPGVDVDDDLPEARRALAVAEAGGFRLPDGDDGALRVLPPPDTTALTGPDHYVVLHPGASVPARAWPPARCAEAVRALRARGHRVVVTGGPAERALTAEVSGGPDPDVADPDVLDLGGRTSYPELAGVLAGADTVIVGNTGPAHLAAAVGTPVVSLFAPVVPASRWAPYRVPCRLLGDQDAACRGTRARDCPVPGHPCLDSVRAEDVVAAVEELAGVTV